MAMKKQIKTKPDDENIEVTTPEIIEEVKEDIALIDESETSTENKTATSEETAGETLTNSIDKLVNAITDKINKSNEAVKQTPPQKKPFKLGFWGYLGLAVVVKGAVEIARAVADSKRPRR